jgi:hypothetical protein
MGVSGRADRLVAGLAVAALLGGSLATGSSAASGPREDAPAAAAQHYVSPSGDDAGPGTKDRPWRTIGHAADALLAGQTVYIRSGTYRERVQPRRSGTATAPITYAAYPGEAPLIDGDGITLPADQAGLFEIRGLGHIRVSGLRIANARPDANSNGILVIGGSHHIVLDGNHVRDTRSSGIGVWDSRNVVIKGNEIVRACSGGSQESLTVAGTDTFEVVGNTIRDTGPDKEGIDAKDGSTNGMIRGNLVHDVPAVGIYIDAWDEATSNIEVSGNTVHHIGSIGIAVASEMGGLLSDIRIVNNVVHHSGFAGIAVTRNGPTDQPHPMAGITIVNNTTWRNGDPWGGGIAIDDPEARDVVVRNNIASDNRSFQVSLSTDVPAGRVTVDHDLIDGYRGDVEDGEIRGEQFVQGDPRFRDAAGGDFHLGAGSPAIDAGSATDAPATDLDGRARPSGAGFDIGAYEVVASVRPTVTAPTVSLRSGAALAGSSIPLVVRWTGSAGGGSGIDRYQLARSRDRGTTWTTVSSSLGTPTANVTTPASGTIRFRARAVDAAGTIGPWKSGPVLTPRLVQHTADAVLVTGSWLAEACASCSGGSTMYAEAAGASARYAFTGRSIALVTSRGPDRGQAEIHVDGTLVVSVDLYAASAANRVLAWQQTWPAPGAHTVSVVVVGTPGRPRVDVDAFAVLR